MLQLDPDHLRLFGIFFPRALQSYMDVTQHKKRFVHYTRAEAALSMFKTGRMWLRKPQWMNDWREIDYGWECLQHTYRDTPAGKHFQAAMEGAFIGINKKITDTFDPWIPHYKLNTFVACVSEHNDAENINGRLSMWRAYGANTGVAIVVKSDPFLKVSDALGAYSSPVSYLTPPEVEAHFESIAVAIEQNIDFVKKVPQERIESLVHEAFRYGMICNKHPGFAEEKEWRIVYSPDRDQKKVLVKSFENVGGVPQPIYSIPLQDVPGYTDLSVPALLDHVIIGPARFPGAYLETFRAALEEAGVKDVNSKVVISDIPLRM